MAKVMQTMGTGAITVLILLAIVDGGLIITGGSAIMTQLFIVSIVCTAGVSMIVWGPIFWLLGMLVKLLHQTFGNQTHQSIQAATSPVAASNPELASFIHKSRRNGASDAQIISRLQQQQWTALEIERAFQQEAQLGGES